uniref:Putative serpin-Z8 n=1 Tax=Aegilops tauschii TaxID=37682 RepID=N1R0F3_AEGTA
MEFEVGPSASGGLPALAADAETRRGKANTYKAEASTVDFQNDPEGARGQINEWAARATQNLIGGVLGPESITPLTRVVLGNAIYFKGKLLEY